MQVLTNEQVEQVAGGRMIYDIFIGIAAGAIWDGVKATYSFYSENGGTPDYNVDVMGNY